MASSHRAASYQLHLDHWWWGHGEYAHCLNQKHWIRSQKKDHYPHHATMACVWEIVKSINKFLALFLADHQTSTSRVTLLNSYRMCLSRFPVVVMLCLDVSSYDIRQHCLTVGVFVVFFICTRFVPVGHRMYCVGSWGKWYTVVI